MLDGNNTRNSFKMRYTTHENILSGRKENRRLEPTENKISGKMQSSSFHIFKKMNGKP